MSPSSFRIIGVDRLHVRQYPESEAMAADAADFVATTIRTAVDTTGEARVIFATGNSQLGFLRHLVARQDVPWNEVVAFHLDEYVGLPVSHPASFRRFLYERLINVLPFRAAHLLDGEAPDLLLECQRYAALLAERPIDAACVGIGENGHLAFNDPPADFYAPTAVHVVTLDAACRAQQVGEGHFPTIDDVPERALSLSVPGIMAAQAISCVVPEARKAAAVRRTLQEPISPDCPASILRTHPNCILFLDAESAGELTL